MKRGFLTSLLLMIVGFFLMGCDFFGATTTTTTTGEDTGTYYTVVFFDGDGSILETQNVLEGEAADDPDTPTKARTAQYTYTFDEWDTDYSNVTEDLLINPIFTQSINQYTVTFYDEDGVTVLGTSTVPYGSAATAPADPTKADDETYTYTFSGWDKAFNNVTGNLSVNATYEATLIASYTVEFYNADGTLISTQQVAEGEDAVAPANPTKAATAQYTYTFNGWDTDFTNVTEDLTVTATYTQTLRQYTVTFYDDDGTTVLSTQTINYGADATAPANPTKAATAQYTYTFSHWDGDFTAITGNVTVTAVYTAVLNQYTVTFYDEDGTTVLGTSTVDYGTAATAPADPTKAGDAQYSYTFGGWDQDFSNVVADISVNATYTQTINQYTVTFYDDDGTTVLGTSTVDYGTAATAPADPTKAGDAQYSYTFGGWDGDFSNVIADISVNATYTQTINQYTVTFYDEDGTTVLGTDTVDYGTQATAPADPFKPSDGTNAYAFDGWDQDFSNITADLTVTATYKAVPLNQTYEVNFYDAQGNIISSQMITHGAAAVAPAAPAKAEDAQYTYTFNRWSETFSNVTGPLDIYPEYNTTLKSYTVNFYDYDNTTVIHTETVPYGGSATAPTAPIKPDDVDYSYTFIGWSDDYTFVMGPMDIYPTYYQTSLLPFTHQMLVDMVDYMFNPYDVEAEILILTDIMEASSEEDLYNMLVAADLLMTQLPTINSVTSMQNWYTQAQTLGFDKDKLINILFNVMLHGMSNDVNYILDEIAYYEDMIADHETELAQLNTDKDALLLAVSDYCALQTGLETICLDYFNAYLNEHYLENAYYETQGPATWEPLWDYDIWWNLEYYVDQVMYYTYDYFDQTEIDYYNGKMSDLLGTLTTEELALYTPVLTAYTEWQTADYHAWYSDWSAVYVLDHTGLTAIDYQLNNFLWGDDSLPDSDPYYWGVVGLDMRINQTQWLIEETTWWLEDLNQDLNMTSALVNYMSDPTGEAEVKALFGTVYDGLEQMMMAVDQEFFDFLQGIIFDLSGMTPKALMEEPYNPFGELLSPENIVMLAGKLETFINAFMGTMDQADFDIIHDALFGFLDSLWIEEGKTEAERIAMLTLLDPVFDKYLGHFLFGYGEVTSFLASIDEEKAQAVLDLIFTVGPHMYIEVGDITRVVEIAKLLDVIVGDGSVDISGLFQRFADIYFDITSGFTADQTYVANIQAQIDTFITDYLALMDVIVLIEPHFISEAEVEQVLEFMAGFYYMMNWFGYGFEAVEEPVVVYEDWFINMLLSYYLGEYDIDNALAKYMDILGTLNGEETFYRLMSLYQYVSFLFNFDHWDGPGLRLMSFAELQVWVGNLETFGFTQADIIGYIAGLLGYEMEAYIEGDDSWFSMEKQWILDDIAWYENEIILNQDENADIDLQIDQEIALLDEALRADAESYWDGYLSQIQLQNAYWDVYALFQGQTDYSATATLEDLAYDLYLYQDDPTNLAIAQTAYDAFYNSYAGTPYIQETITLFKDTYIELNNHSDTFFALNTIISGNTSYDAFAAVVDDNVNYYLSNLNAITAYQQSILDLQDDLQGLVDVYWIEHLIYDLTQDPLTLADTEEAMGILLDDIQNMILAMPAESFMILEKLAAMMEDMYKPRPMMVEEDPMPMEFPFTADEILATLQDFSAMLKLRGQTIDATEEAIMEAFVLTVIETYVARRDLDPTEAADLTSYLNTLILKYFDYLDFGLTELTDLIDGLTVTDVQMIMDLLMKMPMHNENGFTITIKIAQLIQNVIDPAVVDIYGIVEILNEVYMDMNYGTYDTVQLTNLQTAWAAQLDEVFALIDIVSAYDPYNLDPATFGEIYELQQRVMFLFNILDYPEAVFMPPTFTYQYSDFQDLVFMMFDDVTWDNVDARIADLCAVFDLTVLESEQVYYNIMAIAPVMMQLGYLQSPMDILGLYKGLTTLGFTDEEMASYMMNAIMIFLYPTLPDLYDISSLEGDLLYHQSTLAYYQGLIDSAIDDIMTEIGNMTDPALAQATTDFFNTYMDYMLIQQEYNFYYNLYRYNYDMYFDQYLWWDIEYYIEIGDWGSIDNELSWYSWEEQQVYYHLANIYNDYLFRQQLAWDVNDDYWDNYSEVVTTFDNSINLYQYIWDALEVYEDNIYGVIHNTYYAEQLTWEINDMQANAWMIQSLEIFLADTANQDLTELMMVHMMDKMDLMMQSPDLHAIDQLMKLLMWGPEEGINPEELSLALIGIGNFINGVLYPIDPLDEAMINDWITALLDAALETQLTGVDLTAAQAAMALTVDTYLADLLDIPGILASFLQSMDATKTQALIDQMTIINAIPGDSKTPEEAILEIVTMANIITILTEDDMLDYTNTVAPILGVIYDVNVMMGYPPVEDYNVILLTMLSQIDQILVQAELIAPYDVDNLSTSDLADIQDMVNLIEALGIYLDPLLNPGETTPV